MIRIQNLNLQYDSKTILSNLSLEILDNECVALLGESGCGKTSLLRCLAGFERPQSGAIFFDGRDIVEDPVQNRPFNLVFQKQALFEHLNVFENVAFGLRLRKVPENQIQEHVRQALSLFRLNSLEQRSVQTLSGGQAQRVAVARALVLKPRVLLLDEPFSALDSSLREDLQNELNELRKSLQLTMVLVTHDHEEAFMLADRVAVLSHGKILQIATPAELYHSPKSTEVASLVGPLCHYKELASGKTRWFRPESLELSSEIEPDAIPVVCQNVAEFGAFRKYSLISNCGQKMVWHQSRLNPTVSVETPFSFSVKIPENSWLPIEDSPK